MSSTLELPSGKLVDLSRFVALIPDAQTPETHYKLSLEGAHLDIDLDRIDAEFIRQKLNLESEETNDSHVQGQWNPKEQLRKNQPLMKLIQQWRNQRNGQGATEEEIQDYLEIQESLNRNRSLKRTS